MKKNFTLFLMFLLFSSSAIFAQTKGAFTDIYIYKTMFPDIPDRVITFIDSTSFFGETIEMVLTRNLDANNYITSGQSHVTESTFFASDSEDVFISATMDQNSKLTLLNKFVYSDNTTDYTREIIQYTSGLPVLVTIDTMNDASVWGTKYKYEYTYAGNQVSMAKYYVPGSSGLYLNTATKFRYNGNIHLTDTTLAYDQTGKIIQKIMNKYIYSGTHEDTLIGYDISDTSLVYRYTSHYNSKGNIEKIDIDEGLFGNPLNVGADYFYDYSVTAVENSAAMKRAVISNPFDQQIDISNVADMPFELVDVTGKSVLSSRTSVSTPTNHLPSGVYIIRLMADENTYYTRSLVKK